MVSSRVSPQLYPGWKVTLFSQKQLFPTTLSDNALVCLLDLMSDGPVCVLWGPWPRETMSSLPPAQLPQSSHPVKARDSGIIPEPLSASSRQHAHPESGRRGRGNSPGLFIQSAAPRPVVNSLCPVFTTKETGSALSHIHLIKRAWRSGNIVVTRLETEVEMCTN